MRTTTFWMALALCAGCGEDKNNSTDADTDTDTGTGTGSDTGSDTSTGSGTDTGSETDTDTGGHCLADVASFTPKFSGQIAGAVEDCASVTCVPCAVAGGTGQTCGGITDDTNPEYVDCGEAANAAVCTYQLCVERCVMGNEDKDAAKQAVIDAALAADCFSCFSGSADCARDRCAIDCFAGECQCRTCRCDEDCETDFTFCSGLPSSLDCSDPCAGL